MLIYSPFQVSPFWLVNTSVQTALEHQTEAKDIQKVTTVTVTLTFMSVPDRQACPLPDPYCAFAMLKRQGEKQSCLTL